MNIIAIDFGTSRTAVAVSSTTQCLEPELLVLDVTDKIETVLRYDEALCEVDVVGKEAWDYAVQYPDQTFAAFKPELGTGNASQSYSKGRTKAPEVLTLAFLKKLYLLVTHHFNCRSLPSGDYMTIAGFPGSWNEAQKNQLGELIRTAGLPNVTMVPEPVGAAFYYHYRADLSFEEGTTFLLYDFGGGTLDICAMQTQGGGKPPVLVGVGGDSQLGGRKFDDALWEVLCTKVARECHAELGSLDRIAIRKETTDLKEKLSRQIQLGSSIASSTIPKLECVKKEFRLELSREEFEEATADLRRRCDEAIPTVLASAGLSAADIDSVFLAGGSSQLHFVRDTVQAAFPELPRERIISPPQPQEIVAKGLALYGAHILSSGKQGKTSARLADVLHVRGRHLPELTASIPRRRILKYGLLLLLAAIVGIVAYIILHDTERPPRETQPRWTLTLFKYYNDNNNNDVRKITIKVIADGEVLNVTTPDVGEELEDGKSVDLDEVIPIPPRSKTVQLSVEYEEDFSWWYAPANWLKQEGSTRIFAKEGKQKVTVSGCQSVTFRFTK